MYSVSVPGGCADSVGAPHLITNMVNSYNKNMHAIIKNIAHKICLWIILVMLLLVNLHNKNRHAKNMRDNIYLCDYIDNVVYLPKINISRPRNSICAGAIEHTESSRGRAIMWRGVVHMIPGKSRWSPTYDQMNGKSGTSSQGFVFMDNGGKLSTMESPATPSLVCMAGIEPAR